MNNKSQLNRSRTIINGVSNPPGKSINNIKRDQYDQRGAVINVHTGEGNFDNHYESTRFVDSAHDIWSASPNGERFSERLAGNAKGLFDLRDITKNGGKRRYTYHKKSKRSHSKTGWRRRKHSTTKRHRRGRK